MKSVLIIILCCLIIGGCGKGPDHHYVISIENNSGTTISLYGAYILPDTAISIIKPVLKIASPGKVTEIYDDEVNDDKFNRLESNKLTIFIFNSDSVARYPWDTIRLNYRILKKYELNKNDLNNMGGYIKYP